MVFWIEKMVARILLASLLLVIFVCSHSFAQSNEDFFREYYTFNTKHEKLAQFQGKWKLAIELHSKEGPEYAQGISLINLVLNYRILEFKDSIISSVGIPYESRTYIGYDGIRKKYFLVSFNSLTNAVVILNGTYLENQNQFIFEGKTDDPKTKESVSAVMKIIWERDNKFWIEYSHKQKNKETLISKAMYVKLPQE